MTDPSGIEFADLDKIENVGIYPNYKVAYEGWRAKAMTTVNDANIRYFIVHLHRFMETGEHGEHRLDHD